MLHCINSENKQGLIRFLGEYIVNKVKESPLPTGKHLILAGVFFSNPGVVKTISGSSAVECPGMFSSHEEADTRMILHDVTNGCRIS